MANNNKFKAFAEPVLKGARFDGHQVPVEMLPDLATFREIILRIAKQLYRERYGRARVPKGFNASFELNLVQIKEGSAAFVLERAQLPPPPPPKGVDDEGWDPFDAAREHYEKYLGAVGHGKKTDDLAPAVLGLFTNLGKHLRDSEQLLFKSESRPNGVAYTQEVRKRIVLKTADTYEKEVAVSGTVIAVDALRKSFKIQIEDEETNEVSSVHEVHFEAIQDVQLTTALRDRQFTKLELVILGRFDADDVLKKISEVKELTVVETVNSAVVMRIEKRLLELESLEAGWRDGVGEKLAPDGVAWVRQVLLTLISRDNLQPPHLYPTDEGNIRAEWTFGKWELSTEFELSGHSILMDATEVGGDGFEQKSFEFRGEPDEELEISNFVSKYQPRNTPTGGVPS